MKQRLGIACSTGKGKVWSHKSIKDSLCSICDVSANHEYALAMILANRYLPNIDPCEQVSLRKSVKVNIKTELFEVDHKLLAETLKSPDLFLKTVPLLIGGLLGAYGSIIGGLLGAYGTAD